MTARRTMRAVVLTGHGGLDLLDVEEAWPVPEPAPDEVLVAVGACALNATDLNTRTGWYGKGGAGGAGAAPIAFPRIQGADVCGRVVACGDSAPAALLGERVLVDPWLRDTAHPDDLSRCGYLGSERDGGYAEYVTVPARNVHPVRSTLSDVELASFPTSAGTAENMLRRARVRPGETVLVTGASGGVGTALVQLVRRRGAVPLAVTPPGLFGDLVGAIERGEIVPHVAATYPLEGVREAQTAFANTRHVGKIVLDLQLPP